MIEVIWYKRDLRIRDHAPLVHASPSEHVLPIYILEPFLFEEDVFNQRHLQFIYESLLDLDQSLKKLGSKLYVYIGEASTIFKGIYDTYGAYTLHSHMEHGTNNTYLRDIKMRHLMTSLGLKWHEYKIFGVNRARGFSNRIRDFHTWLNEGILKTPISIQGFLDTMNLFTHTLNDIQHYPAKGFPVSWFKGGEIEGIKKAQTFFNTRYKKYQVYINKPSLSDLSSSLLSPYLAFGNLSIRMLHLSTKNHLKEIKDNTFLHEQLKAFEKRLYWHCHFIQRVERHPELNSIPWDRRLEGLHKKDDTLLQAFKEGMTGFPIIDACMIALKNRGWVNFKQRAMLASFACNTLLLDFRDVGFVLGSLFIDYEPGIHWSQMQMQAGLNPYRHIPMYDPLKQSQMHDKDATFIKAMIPCLKDVSVPEVFEPWKIDKNPYINPIIDIDKVYHEHKALLYERKSKTKKEHTLFDV